jgi:1-phosphofructokinase family hexose kinase
VRTLGGTPNCVGFVGANDGRQLAALADAEGLRSHWTWIEGETRTCVIVADPQTGRSTVINDVGPSVGKDDWDRLTQDVLDGSQDALFVCSSGSLPPDSPQESFAGLLSALREQGKRVWVDISGVSLQTALSVPGIGIKINHEEASALLNNTIASVDDAFAAAEALSAGGTRPVVITLSPPAAVMLLDGQRYVAYPPHIRSLNNVGSGDSFTAGLVTALDQGREPGEALRWGVAAGAANALTISGAHFSIADFNRILGETTT